MDRTVRHLRALMPDAAALAPPAGSAALVDVVAALAPLRLPPAVLRFWQVAGGVGWAGPLFPSAGPTSPDFALECWRTHREQPGICPDLLFPVGYESHAFVLVELDGPHGEGGACFSWAYGLEPFVLVAADLGAYLEVVAATVEAGHVDHHEHDGVRWSTVDDAAFRAALAERLRRSPHPRWGAAARIGPDPADWPAYWRASGEGTAAPQQLLGATTSLAALESGAAASGRVHAEVVDLWMLGDGFRATLDDGSSRLVVWCPAAVTAYGPVHGRRFELDLAAGVGLPHGAAAEATAVRRLEG